MCSMPLRPDKIMAVAGMLTSTCAIHSAVSAAEFFDDFSTPGFVHAEAGVTWEPPDSTPGLGQDPEIVTETPCATACVRFTFAGDADPQHNGHSELSFARVPGANDLTVVWDQFFPGLRWSHRESPGINKNEFFIAQSASLTETTGLTVEANFDLVAGVEVINVRMRIGNSNDRLAWTQVGSGPGIVADDSADKRDSWLPINAYIKVSSGPAASDGAIRLQVGDDLILDRDDLILGDVPIDIVQFMGHAHSGFSVDSVTYIDNVRVTIPDSADNELPSPPVMLRDQ